MAELATTIEFLKSLNPAQKRAAYEALAFEFRSGTEKAAYSAVELDAWDVAHAALNLRGARQFDLTGSLRKLGGRSGYRIKANRLFELVALASGPMQRTQRLAVAAEALRCLDDYLRGAVPHVTPITLLNNLNSFVAAVDESYPGYVAAGLLAQVARIAA